MRDTDSGTDINNGRGKEQNRKSNDTYWSTQISKSSAEIPHDTKRRFLKCKYISWLYDNCIYRYAQKHMIRKNGRSNRLHHARGCRPTFQYTARSWEHRKSEVENKTKYLIWLINFIRHGFNFLYSSVNKSILLNSMLCVWGPSHAAKFCD